MQKEVDMETGSMQGAEELKLISRKRIQHQIILCSYDGSVAATLLR